MPVVVGQEAWSLWISAVLAGCEGDGGFGFLHLPQASTHVSSPLAQALSQPSQGL